MIPGAPFAHFPTFLIEKLENIALTLSNPHDGLLVNGNAPFLRTAAVIGRHHDHFGPRCDVSLLFMSRGVVTSPLWETPDPSRSAPPGSGTCCYYKSHNQDSSSPS